MHNQYDKYNKIIPYGSDDEIGYFCKELQGNKEACAPIIKINKDSVKLLEQKLKGMTPDNPWFYRTKRAIHHHQEYIVRMEEAMRMHERPGRTWEEWLELKSWEL